MMDQNFLTVTELTRAIKSQLEGDYADVWVEGEVTNYRGPATSGHRYFSLKDASAQLRAVLFKGASSKGLAFDLQEGQQVLAHGRISVYEPRGEYQLVADRLEPKGLGALQLAFEQLKRKLEAEGLFDPARKRSLPAYPRKIVVVTSPTGAVIRDILHVCARRCPWIDVVVLPVRVQGQGAGDEISAALRYASAHLFGKADLLLLARGGGSLEDLWAFNEESVARAIADCRLPVISAVGHEVDFTIADFVADLRAPTPSAAAEILSPSGEELRLNIGRLTARAAQGVEQLIQEYGFRLGALSDRLKRCHPKARIEFHAQRLDELRSRFSSATKRLLLSKREALGSQAGRLNALSPLGILSRGYAACFDAQGRLLRAAHEVLAGDSIEVRLGAGSLGATVKEIRG
jgi:exodeoxyribonuclease VII large subunit